jgi:hypothetical protein
MNAFEFFLIRLHLQKTFDLLLFVDLLVHYDFPAKKLKKYFNGYKKLAKVRHVKLCRVLLI